MSIEARATKLIAEAIVLSAHYGISAEEQDLLARSVTAYNKLWNSEGYVGTEALESALDTIDSAIEDVCLAHKVTEEGLESHCKQIKAY